MACYNFLTKLSFEVWPYISVLTLSWVMRFPFFSYHSPLTPLKLLSFSGPLAMCEVSPRYPHHSKCLPFPFLSLKGTQVRQSVKSRLVAQHILLFKDSKELRSQYFPCITDSISKRSSVWSPLCDNPFPELLHRAVCWPESWLLAGCSPWPSTASIQKDIISNLHKGALWAGSSPVPSSLWASVLPARGNWARWFPKHLLALWFEDLLRQSAWLAKSHSCSVLLPCLECLWSQRGKLCARKSKGLRREGLLGCSEDRALKTGLDSVEASIGSERPWWGGGAGCQTKGRCRQVWPDFLSIRAGERSRSPSGSMQRENSGVHPCIFSPWPDHRLASYSTDLDTRVTRCLGWAKG